MSLIICVDRTLCAHRHDHRRNLCDFQALRENVTKLLRCLLAVVICKKDSCLKLIADKAVKALEEVPTLNRNAHVADHTVELLVVLLAKLNHLLDDLLVDINFQNHRITVLDDLISVLLENRQNRHQVRALGNRSGQISAVVKDCQPGSHSIRNRLHVLRIYLVIL